MMIAYLVNEYLSQHEMSLQTMAKKLGFSDKQVRHWSRGKHIPYKFSAECLVSLFLRDIAEKHKLEYESVFWHVWKLDTKLHSKSRAVMDSSFSSK
jgi:hypothetical protein